MSRPNESIPLEVVGRICDLSRRLGFLQGNLIGAAFRLRLLAGELKDSHDMDWAAAELNALAEDFDHLATGVGQ